MRRRVIASVLAAVTVAGCGSAAAPAASPAVAISVPGSFRALRAADGFQVSVVPGSPSSATVTVTGMDPGDIVAVVRHDTLRLGARADRVPPGAQLTATVASPRLAAVTATSGAVVSVAPGASLSGGSVRIDVSAGGQVNGPVEAIALAVTLQAGAGAQLAGSADRAHVQATSAATLTATDLAVADAVVAASGGSSVAVAVTSTLAATVDSGATVSYVGDPRILRRDVASGGSLTQVPR